MTPSLHDSSGSAASQRASDSDRENAAQVVHLAAGAGMLTLEETEERLSAAYATRFRHQIVPLLADLPVDEARPGPAHTIIGRAQRWLGHGAAVAVLVALGWASRHRVTAVVLGVFIAALAVALVVVAGVDGLGGNDHGAGMMEA